MVFYVTVFRTLMRTQNVVSGTFSLIANDLNLFWIIPNNYSRITNINCIINVQTKINIVINEYLELFSKNYENDKNINKFFINLILMIYRHIYVYTETSMQ